MQDTFVPLRFDAAFPGGNIRLERIEGDDIHLRQDLRDTEGWWFYWAFRVRGAAGRTLRFHFTDGEPVGTRGAAWSSDGGETWQWQEGEFTKNAFTFAFPAQASEVRLAYGMVYTQHHWDRFLARVTPSPWLKADVLATSRHGRPVERLLAGCHANSQHRVLITARHHCCEMMASYVLEGVIEEVLADADAGRWLREHVQVMIVPFVDKDGVEAGDQGKNRRPHDHNRDYAGTAIYPEVAAIRSSVPRWSEGRLDVTLDIHCPWIRGRYNEFVYQVGQADAAVWSEQQRFGGILEHVQTGPLEYHNEDNLPFGQSWNTGTAGLGMSCSCWGSKQAGVRLASSFEVPYATARGHVVDQGSARAFGHDLARALAAYLQAPR